MMAKKPVTEYRWAALHPDDNHVVEYGTLRTDRKKAIDAATYMKDEIDHIDDPERTRHLSRPYWRGLKIVLYTRTISPWVEMDDWEA